MYWFKRCRGGVFDRLIKGSGSRSTDGGQSHTIIFRTYDFRTYDSRADFEQRHLKFVLTTSGDHLLKERNFDSFPTTQDKRVHPRTADISHNMFSWGNVDKCAHVENVWQNVGDS